MGKKLMMIPLSKLQRSDDNVRKTGATSDIEELAASIASLGVLQNLSVRPVNATKGKSNGAFEVVAGARRLAALKLLAKRRKIAKNYPVPCSVLNDDGAVEISLAENVVRAPLHPADQFDAFSQLHAKGQGIEDIAARFGIAPKLVQQRLKLAAVNPKLMDVYRAGEMTLDQLVAFTLTDDHEAQERVWFDALGYDRSPQTIRRLLTTALVEGSDRRARFIGADAYEAAGGTIVRDLFRSDDDAYFADSQLLDRLVSEKLSKEAETIKAEGWAWVEVLPEIDYGELAQFRRLTPTEMPLSEEEEAKIEELSTKYDELVADIEEDSSREDETELNKVSAELDALVKRKEQWTDEQKAAAGVAISLDYQGKLSVIRGLVKDDAQKADDPDTSVASGGAGKEKPRRPRSGRELPDRLLEDLSAHRTAALRETLAARPDVALSALLHALALRIFFNYAGDTCVDIRPHVVDLKPSAEGIGESKAVAALASRHQKWHERLPAPEKLFAWIVEQNDEIRLELLAYCVAVSVNALRRRYDVGSEDRLDQANTLATAVALAMADWWEPTKERYLSSVSKAHIVAAVAEAVSKSAAENIAEMKKEPMARRAEELLAGSRWLPEPLRTHTSATEPAGGAY